MAESEALPYWQVNVEEHDRTAECPDGLRGLSAKDIGILSTPDSAYRTITWDEVRAIVESNRLEKFERVPSDLRRYRIFVHNIKKQFGSIEAFILQERLGWSAPLQPQGHDFENPNDYKILLNDWPYGIDKRIVHLVIWTKFNFEYEEETQDLSNNARAVIERFVSCTFRARMPPDTVLWFKNWPGLQSVRAVDHVHVMLLDPTPDFVKDVTNNDVARRQLHTSR